jgi:hypothetical protein
LYQPSSSALLFQSTSITFRDILLQGSYDSSCLSQQNSTLISTQTHIESAIMVFLEEWEACSVVSAAVVEILEGIRHLHRTMPQHPIKDLTLAAATAAMVTQAAAVNRHQRMENSAKNWTPTKGSGCCVRSNRMRSRLHAPELLRVIFYFMP